MSNIIKPPTADTLRDERELLLEVPLDVAELLSFDTRILSPLHIDHLRDVAQALRTVVEPHTHTKIPGDMIVRTERPSDEFIRQQCRFDDELHFALWVLAITDAPSEKSQMFFEEAMRLRTTAEQKIATGKNTIAMWHYMLRSASVLYHAGARFKSKEFVEGGAEIFEMFQRTMEGFSSAVPVFIAEFRRRYANSEQEDLRLCGGVNWENETDQERDLFTAAILREDQSMLPEIAFGLARCHALTGDHAAAYRAIGAFETYNKQAEDLSAPPLVESVQLLLDALKKAKPGEAIIAPSPLSVLDHAHRCAQKFGKVPPRVLAPDPPRIWMP